MNFASSPQIQARRTVSETLQKEYILRYQRSAMGTTFSSTGFHKVITSVMLDVFSFGNFGLKSS